MALLSACTYWTTDFKEVMDQSDRDFQRDPQRKPVSVELGKLIDYPTSYEFMEVRFEGIMNRHSENVFSAVYNAFNKEDYYAFSLWPCDARLWELPERMRSLPTIYVRKDNSILKDVLSTPRYAVVEIRGRAVNIFEGMLCIDVTNYNVVSDPIYDEEALADLVAGLNEAEGKRTDSAVSCLESALQGTLADLAREVACIELGRLHFELGSLYEGQGDYASAIEHYQSAGAYDAALRADTDARAASCRQAWDAELARLKAEQEAAAREIQAAEEAAEQKRQAEEDAAEKARQAKEEAAAREIQAAEEAAEQKRQAEEDAAEKARQAKEEAAEAAEATEREREAAEAAKEEALEEVPAEESPAPPEEE